MKKLSIDNNYLKCIIILLVFVITYRLYPFGKASITQLTNEKVKNGEKNDDSWLRSRLDGPLSLDNLFLVN